VNQCKKMYRMTVDMTVYYCLGFDCDHFSLEKADAVPKCRHCVMSKTFNRKLCLSPAAHQEYDKEEEAVEKLEDI